MKSHSLKIQNLLIEKLYSNFEKKSKQIEINIEVVNDILISLNVFTECFTFTENN